MVSLEPLWRAQTQFHRICVACLDMPLGILLGIPYGVTVSTWSGIVERGERPARGMWFWCPLARILDRHFSRLGVPHTEDARLADIERNLQTAALLLLYGPPKDAALAVKVSDVLFDFIGSHPEEAV
jgi:hypothetical protein